MEVRDRDRQEAVGRDLVRTRQGEGQCPPGGGDVSLGGGGRALSLSRPGPRGWLLAGRSGQRGKWRLGRGFAPSQRSTTKVEVARRPALQ